jgi:nicotinate-nucleotide--dimethylbenzimidazole phosphoribosyltransferase
VILDEKLKPPGSLGKLEDLAVRMGGIYGFPLPDIHKKAIVMMASDNGVYEEGVNQYPQEITRALVEMAGPGLIAVSVLARHAKSRLVVVDIGVKSDIKGTHVITDKKVRYGTGNIAAGPAMSREEAVKAIEAGIEVTKTLIDEGVQVIGTGEVGLCNTTTSAAVLVALTGKNPEDIVGGGTGTNDNIYKQKVNAVKNALAVNQPNPQDPIDVVSKVGGLEIAGLMGCYLAAASLKKLIVIDGFIAGVAALAASRINPHVKEYMIPSHLSAEKGARAVLEALNMEAMLMMDMRLGEGTGAALAFNLLDASWRIFYEMGTFADLKE